MVDMVILYVAVGVFTLMIVGLALTVREFRTNIIATPERKADTNREPTTSETRRPQLRRVA